MKLTAAEQEIVDLLKAGWDLTWSAAMGGAGHYAIQEGGRGSGGECRYNIKSTVVHNLVEKGVLERFTPPNKAWYNTHYRIAKPKPKKKKGPTKFELWEQEQKLLESKKEN